MSEAVLRGIPAAPGTGVGRALLVEPAADVAPAGDPAAELQRARRALAQAREELEATAAQLRAAGHPADAEIVATSALMAADPALEVDVATAVFDGLSAPTAIAAAAEGHAARIAALGDERLAARAADVRSLGRRAAALAAGAERLAPAGGGDVVLVATDLGPADVADLDGVAGIALAAGGPTAHAAIVARSLGVPMVVGVGDALLAVAAGERLAVDGDRGVVLRRPRAARAAPRARAAVSHGPVATADGHRVRVLVNAAGAAEVRAGLRAGAEGVGLLRTELAFLRAAAWPTEAEHRAALAPALAALPAGATATVRLLDLGGDKTPPFLGPGRPRGIALLLGEPEALRAQLRAIAAAGDGHDLRVLLPMAETPEQVRAVRAALPDGVAVGAMVETPSAARGARALAAASDFLSIGTNDLAHETLGTDRFAGGEAVAHHPEVLRHVASTVAAGRPVEVCGEAASDPLAMPLLVGLGVAELSVGAARVATVRTWVRALSRERAALVAARALECDGADAVAALVRAELGGLAEAGQAAGEPGDGGLAVGALRADQQG